MRIAVAVEGEHGLESTCSASLEAAACWVIAELNGGQVISVGVAPNPMAVAVSAQLDGAAVHALRLDAVVAACASARTKRLLMAQGVQVAVGAQGTARRALIAYVTGGLGSNEVHSHSSDG